MNLGQLIWMHCIFHLMRCVWQGREHHRTVFFIHLKKHSSAFPVCDLRPSDLFLGTAFLWNHISCHIIFYHIVVDSKLCTFLTVCIGLSFSKSIPGYMIIICIKLENHTKFRHIAKLLHRIIGKCGTNSSISENFISKCTLSRRNSWKKIGIGYLYGMLFFLYLWYISRSICRSAVILMVYIHAGNLPLSISHCHQISTVIVCWCTPEIRLRNCLDHFFSCIFIGNKTTVQYGEKHLKFRSAHANIMGTVNYLQMLCARLHSCFHLVNILSKGNLMTCFRPWHILFQMERNSYRVLTCFLLLLKWKSIFHLAQRSHCCIQYFCTNYVSILLKGYSAFKCVRIYKQIFVDHIHGISTYLCGNILIIKFHFLHLRRRITISTICNTISTEIIISRTLAKISAICLELFSITVFFVNRLIDIIPDKATLIFRLCICQICIFMHGTAGISHGMGILTTDKGLGIIFCKKLFNCFHRWIHLAFHIAGSVISAVMADTFIMYQTGRICISKELGHFKNILTTEGLISTGPDQDCRMVLISLIHGIGAV